jgi:hypothetical protein
MQVRDGVRHWLGGCLQHGSLHVGGETVISHSVKNYFRRLGFGNLGSISGLLSRDSLFDARLVWISIHKS